MEVPMQVEQLPAWCLDDPLLADALRTYVVVVNSTLRISGQVKVARCVSETLKAGSRDHPRRQLLRNMHKLCHAKLPALLIVGRPGNPLTCAVHILRALASKHT